MAQGSHRSIGEGFAPPESCPSPASGGRRLKRLGKLVLPGRLEAPLGYPGPSPSCPGQPRAAGAPPSSLYAPSPPATRKISSPGRPTPSSGQLSWSSARLRALGPRRAVGVTGRGGAAAWRDGVWRRSFPHLASPALRLGRSPAQAQRRYAVPALGGAFGAGAPIAAAPPSVQARAGTGATAFPTPPSSHNSGSGGTLQKTLTRSGHLWRTPAERRGPAALR